MIAILAVIAYVALGFTVVAWSFADAYLSGRDR